MINPELIEAIDSLPAGEKMNQADLETVKAIRDTCMQSYPNTPNRIRAEALTALLDEHESLSAEVTELKAEKDRWRLALEGLTPQGSEFVNDLNRCVLYVRHNFVDVAHEAKKNLVRANREIAELKAEVNRLKGELRDARIQLGVERTGF